MMAASQRQRFHLFLVVVWSLLNIAYCESPGSCPNNNCPAAPPTTTNGLFGLWSSRTTPEQLSKIRRGGGGEAVQDCPTLQDVESALSDAGGETLVVIDFSATWCGPCKMIAPLFEEMAANADGQVVFLKVDVDENPDTAAKYAVSAMPTFVFIKGGEVVDRLMGANPTRLQELIDQHR